MIKLLIILTNLILISACGTVASNTKIEGKKMANGKRFHSYADIVASVVFPLAINNLLLLEN